MAVIGVDDRAWWSELLGSGGDIADDVPEDIWDRVLSNALNASAEAADESLLPAVENLDTDLTADFDDSVDWSQAQADWADHSATDDFAVDDHTDDPYGLTPDP
jgi:hypothetical protein